MRRSPADMMRRSPAGMIRHAFLGLLLALPAAAQQVLYEPLPPAGSAYLRIVNATAEPLTIRPGVVGNTALGTEPAARVSPYTVQENVAERAVEITLSAGAARGEATLRLEAGSFTTLIVVADGAVLRATPVLDQTQFNQTRARLSFYNAGAACGPGGLALAPEGQSVFADIAPMAARMRSVNPVSAQVTASCASARTAPFALGEMVAGGKYSVWLMAPRGQPIGFVTRDATTPWRR